MEKQNNTKWIPLNLHLWPTRILWHLQRPCPLLVSFFIFYYFIIHSALCLCASDVSRAWLVVELSYTHKTEKPPRTWWSSAFALSLAMQHLPAKVYRGVWRCECVLFFFLLPIDWWASCSLSKNESQLPVRVESLWHAMTLTTPRIHRAHTDLSPSTSCHAPPLVSTCPLTFLPWYI